MGKELPSPFLKLPLRDYAHELSTLVGDSKATNQNNLKVKRGKAEELHAFLDDLLNENDLNKVENKLRDALKNLTFSQHRHLIHFGGTNTIKLLKTAIVEIDKVKKLLPGHNYFRYLK